MAFKMSGFSAFTKTVDPVIGGNTKNLVACIGPCIDKKNYEVEKDFYENFISQNINNKRFFEKVNDTKSITKRFIKTEIK